MTKVTSLLDRLPAVRGRLTEGASLAKVTWFRVGGPAEVLFKRLTAIQSISARELTAAA